MAKPSAGEVAPWTVPWWLIVCFGLGLVPTSIHAQWLADPGVDNHVQAGISHIYNLEFYDADKQFDEVIRLRPDHPAGPFFKAMTQWWRILSNFDDESQDDRFYDMLENVINICDKLLEKNPDNVTALFFEGGALGFRGRLRANRGNWFGAARDGLAALPIVQKAYELDPNNSDILLGIGIYNYYADIIPSEYPIVKPFMLFFPTGDRKKGLEQLQAAAENSRYAKTEASYFLVQNYFLYEKDYRRALPLAKKLNAEYPRNPLFHRYLGRCYVSIGNWEDAYAVFSEVLNRVTAKQVGYDSYDAREAAYYTGKYLFTKSDNVYALTSFQKCDELSSQIDKGEASGFKSMANLHIGMIYDLQSKRTEARAQYRKVLGMKEFESTHADARKYLQQPYKRPF